MESIWRCLYVPCLLPGGTYKTKRPVRMVALQAQIPNVDPPDKKLKGYCVTDYCYLLPAVT
jgi:hypothetical protein